MTPTGTTRAGDTTGTGHTAQTGDTTSTGHTDRTEDTAATGDTTGDTTGTDDTASAVMPALRVPGHVHAAEARHGGMVLLNARTGQWYAMNATARALWTEWRRTGDFESGIRIASTRYPRTPAPRLRHDAQTLVADLLSRGLVVPERRARQQEDRERRPRRRELRPRRPAPESRGVRPPAAPRAGAPASHPPPAARVAGLARRHRVAGVLGLALALCLLRFPFRVAPRVVGALKRWRCRRGAGMAEAEAVLAAVRRAGRRHPGRIACLEHSLGAALGLALAGLAVDWCLGYADDPYRFHAWVEVGGALVPHPDDLDRGPFRRVLTV
jgi:hypothetical protein